MYINSAITHIHRKLTSSLVFLTSKITVYLYLYINIDIIPYGSTIGIHKFNLLPYETGHLTFVVILAAIQCAHSSAVLMILNMILYSSSTHGSHLNLSSL